MGTHKLVPILGYRNSLSLKVDLPLNVLAFSSGKKIYQLKELLQMKKKLETLMLLLSILSGNILYAQNLVPNPSFEVYDTCPTTMNAVQNAQGWSSFIDSPDYFNACSPNLNVPETPFGHQNASEGDGLVGAIICAPLALMNLREIFGTQLLQPLIIGHKYYVSLKTVRSDERGGHNCACNGIGARFTTFSIHEPEGYTGLINNSPQIYSSNIISDSLNWSSIQGSFIADSAYQYITIGNFLDDFNTDTLNCPYGGAYYFFDNICVSSDSITCFGVDNISEINKSSIYLSPNPASDFILLTGKIDPNTAFNLINCMGQIVRNEPMTFSSTGVQIYVGDISSGLYFLKVIQSNSISVFEVLISN